MRSKNEKKVILAPDDIGKIAGLVSIPEIQHIFNVTSQGIYHHIRTGRLHVYKWGWRTLIDPLEYAQMQKWDRKYTTCDGKRVYDETNFSLSYIGKKLGFKYHHLYHLITKGLLQSKKVGKCIVISVEDVLACAELKDKAKELLEEFAYDEYINRCDQRLGPVDEKKVSVV